MSASQEKLVPIRTVCAMYGLNPNTLRTWERRYGIIKPSRSEGGHRGYAGHDITAIERMLAFLGEGKPPAEAAAAVARQPAKQARAPSREVRKHRASFRAGVLSLNTASALHRANSAVKALGYQAAIEHVLFPELASLGDQWQLDSTGVAQEHLASLAIRSILLERLHETKPKAQAVPVLLACAPGEEHELPILHLANLIASEGKLRPEVFGAGMPVPELVASARLSGSRAILLSATMIPRADVLRQWVAELRQSGWDQKTILAGDGFSRSRIFSQTNIRTAPGNYLQAARMMERFALQAGQ